MYVAKAAGDMVALGSIPNGDPLAEEAKT
jgi:hypothetical protein